MSDEAAAKNPGNWHKDGGFEYALFPAKTEKPEGLIIYMHGIGDNAQNFEPVAEMIQQKMPGATVIALQGPIEYQDPEIPPGQKGYAWFPFGGPVLPQAKTLLSHVFNRVAVVKQVQDFARKHLEELGLTEKNLAYVGVSMGSIIGLQAGLSSRKPVAAIVARGGAVPPMTRVRNKSAEVFLQMGDWDDLFNPGAPAREKNFLKRIFNAVMDKFSLRHEKSVERLKAKKVATTDKFYPMQGHILDFDAWQDSADFAVKALKKNAPKP